VIIKYKKKRFSLLLKIFLVLFLSFFILSKDGLSNAERTGLNDILIDEFLQNFMSMNLGFSSIRNLIDDGRYQAKKPFISSTDKALLLANKIPSAILGVVKYKFNSNPYVFHNIDIDIDLLEYAKILSDRKKSLERGILYNPTSVKANVRFNGITYKAEIRLKGDISGHWRAKERISLRVKLKGGKTILGFRSFSLYKLRERQYPYDHVFQRMVRGVNNLSSVDNVIHVYLNGDDWGIMGIEEHISEEFLEKQKRKKSVVIRFSNDEKWFYEHITKNPYPGYLLSHPSLYIHLYSSKKALKDFQNRKMYSYILTKNINDVDLYDFNSIYKSYVLSKVWGSSHTLENNNARYYFNPYTLRLEIITTDQGYWDKATKFSNLPSNIEGVLSSRMPDYNVLNEVNDVVDSIDEFLSDTYKIFPLDLKKDKTVILENMKNVMLNKDKYLIPASVNDSVNTFNMPSYQQASKLRAHLHIRHFTDGNIELYNLLPYEVTVKDISYKGVSFSNKEIVIPSYLSNKEPVEISTPYIGIQDNAIKVRSEFLGFSRESNNNITLVSEEVENPLLSETVNNHSLLENIDDGVYKIKDGKWDVNKPIVVKGNLHISPGVNLSFSNNSYMIVMGALIAEGTKNNPIVFTSKENSWKGVYVLNSKNKSTLKNVNFFNISALNAGLLSLSGAITFYKSNIDMKNVYVDTIDAEDAINIVSSKFILRDIYINNVVSDGMDFDFSDGKIDNLSVLNSLGDGLDFSGSNVTVNRINAENIRDKAISVGEESRVIIKNSNLNSIGVGVVSKDGSIVTMYDTSILKYKLYSVMSYIKKDYYGAPTFNIYNSNINNSSYIKQKGSSMTIDSYEVESSDLNINELYRGSVMSKNM
jgi:hypothetical protein